MELLYPRRLTLFYLLALTSASIGLPADTQDRDLEFDPASKVKNLGNHIADINRETASATPQDEQEPVNTIVDHQSTADQDRQPSFSCSPTYTINVEPTACQCESDRQVEQLRQQVEWLTTEVNNLKNSRNYHRPGGKPPTGGEEGFEPKDCADLIRRGYTDSGVYVVQPADGKETIEVYCDMDTDGGGWTVFQRRQDGSVNFYRDWDAYKYGFGEIRGEFWLGNQKIHRLTVQDNYDLRIDLSDTAGKSAYASYDDFGVASETVFYKLSLGSYTGTAGDSFGSERHRNMKFSTRDTDNDIYDGHCARTYKGGWWYGACHHANLNGLYHHGDNPDESGDGISWEAWRGYHYSMKYTDMKIRPHNFDTLQ